MRPYAESVSTSQRSGSAVDGCNRVRRRACRPSNHAAVPVRESRTCRPVPSARARAGRPRRAGTPSPWSSAWAGRTPGGRPAPGRARRSRTGLDQAVEPAPPRPRVVVQPHARSSATTRPGRRSSSAAAPSPWRSSAPGRYPVTTTSAASPAAPRRSARSAGSSRSSRVRPLAEAGVDVGADVLRAARARRPAARRRRAAPRVRVATGPASTRVRSSTRTPSAGRVAVPPRRRRAGARRTGRDQRHRRGRPGREPPRPRARPPRRPASCTSTAARSATRRTAGRQVGVVAGLRDPERGEQPRPVVRVVRVRAHPAVGRLPEARQRREQRGSAGRPPAGAARW